MSGMPLEVPIELTRQRAAELAEAELTDPDYVVEGPSLFERAWTWVSETLDRLLAESGGALGDVGGFLLLGLLLALLAIAILVRTGGLRRTATTETPLFVGGGGTSAGHREAAERHATAGRWDEAVRERLRAIVRDLEERGLIDERPGRTAEEVATDGAAALPDRAADLRRAVTTFEEIWYGRRPGTAESYAVVRQIDESVRTARARTRVS